MKKLIPLFCMLAIWSCAITAATTSYNVTAEQYARDEPTTDKIVFNLTEISAAAGFRSPAEMQEVMTSEHIFWGNDTIGGGELTNDYTHISGGFYFSGDGYVAPKKDQDSKYFKPYFFSYFRADMVRNELICHIGQIPDKCRAGDIFLTQMFLIHEKDTVEFNITLTIKKCEQTLPIPTMQISKLDITGETDVHLTITRKFPALLKVGMKEIAEEFGVDMNVPHIIENMLYACCLSAKTMKRTDELIGYDGRFIFKTEETDDEISYPCIASPSIDVCYSDCFTVRNLYYEPSCENLVARIEAEYIYVGEQYKAELYIVYGNKAHRINLYVQSEEEQPKKLEEYEYMGQDSIKLEFTPTETVIFNIDINQITEKLNCKNNEISLLTLDDNNYLDGNLNPGNFEVAQFKVSPYKRGSIRYVVYLTINKEQMTVYLSEMTGMSLGRSFTSHLPLLFIYDGKYYKIELIITLVSNVMEFDDGEEIGNEDIYVQVLKNIDKNYCTNTLSINIPRISELIHTEVPELFVYKRPESQQKKAMISNDFNYLVNNNGPKNETTSFCIDQDGYLIPDSIFRSREEDDKYMQLRYDNSRSSSQLQISLNNTINTYIGSLFFVNPKSKEYYTINYTVEPVDEYTPMEYVGEEEILLPASHAAIRRTELDISKAIEALGIQNEDSLVNMKCLANRSDRSTFLYASTGYNEAEGGFPFDSAGCLDTKEENDAFHVGYIQEGGKHYFTCSIERPLENGQEYTTRLALEYENKRYIFHIKLVDEDTYVTIDEINTTYLPHDDIVYDLHGRIVGQGRKTVEKLGKGIYILNGHKIAVK